jgi:TRAP-type C4-dicarboxylate transport system permease small subunit
MFYRPALPEPIALRVIGDAIDLVIVALGAGMVALMALNVFSRASDLIDLAANVELGEFLLVWATFLGGASAARRMGHMRVTEIVDALPPRIAGLLDQAMRLLSLMLLALIVWKGASIVGTTWGQKSSVLYWPVGLTYLAMPAGAALCMIFIAHQIARPPARAPAADLA